MKKVGILNVQCVDNYGAVLLAYALQESIHKLGYDAEIIDYRPLSENADQSLQSKVKSALSDGGIKGLAVKVRNKITGNNVNKHNVNFSSDVKKKRFSDFRANYLKRSCVYHDITVDDDLDYDIYVAGSDVIWKPDRVKSNESNVYFLEFTKGKECRRISYAASIGTDDKDTLDSIEEKFARLIQKFDAVSVREGASIQFVKKAYGHDVTWAMDPTLLLKREEYDCLLESVEIEETEQPYIYLYVFEDNQTAFDMANRLNRELGMPVVCQCPAPDKIDNLLEYSRDDGPLEFVNRIRNASLVITDSFHGTVFAIIYRKDFYTLSRGKISIRMQDLLTRLGLMSRFIGNDSNVSYTQADYQNVDEIIEEWREESMNYLVKNLTGGGYRKEIILIYIPCHFYALPRENEVAA